jgi:MICOS complex subunit MIC12
VTLVLGISYLSLQAHRRIRERQAETLRANTYILNSLSYIPATAPPPKTLAEELALLEQQQELLARAEAKRRNLSASNQSFLDKAKDRWNAEVEGAVRWAANKDWVAVREDAETAASRLWARASGAEVQHDTARWAGAAVSNKAGEAKEAAESLWERGFQKGKEIADQARAGIAKAEEKAQDVVRGATKQTGGTDIEKVLQQRYERTPDEALSKSPEELLEERYRPMVEQDNTKLRGL